MYLSPKLNAIMNTWRLDMQTYGSATFKTEELEAAIAEEVTLRREREQRVWSDLNSLETSVINAKPIKSP